eukprot:Seg1123.14 transcript_id=Seg1123.14/GoldUCD/mRNA.D3Y31 product="hypothetical protein" protein_id=Seg1123.14/GoldUCD/D3Y31
MQQDGIKAFSVNEVKLFGKQDANYKRAMQCIGNLSNIKIGHHPTADDGDVDIFEASCCCAGSTSSTYNLHIRLSLRNKEIQKATCSCPYKERFSKEDEHCKHILAFLLKSFCYDYQEQNFDSAISSLQKSSKAALPGEKASALKSKIPMEATKKRELPAWMKVKQEHTNKPFSMKKKRLSLLSRDKSAPKNTLKKQGSFVKRTVYCMTPKEFSSTAQEILREADLQLEAEEHQSAGIIEKAEHHISTEEDNVTKMDVNMKRESQLQKLAKDDPENSTLETLLILVDTTQREKDLFSSTKTLKTLLEDAAVQTTTGLSINNSQDARKDDYSILDELM